MRDICEGCIAREKKLCHRYFVDAVAIPCGLFLVLMWWEYLPELTPEDAKFTGLN
jgi:hypothetical protein